MSAQAGKENENDPSTDCPPQMGRKLAAGTMPNLSTTDPPLLAQLFRESIVITDKEILFIIDRDAKGARFEMENSLSPINSICNTYLFLDHSQFKSRIRRSLDQ